MVRTVPIRRSLLWNVVTAIVLFGAAVMATTYVGRQQAVKTASESVIGETLNSAEAQLRRLFDPAVDELMLARAWGEAGLLDTSDAEALDRLAIPVIKQRELISAAMLANERGEEYMLLQLGGLWRNRLVRLDEWGGEARWREWTEEDETPRVRTETIDYDPWARPWYVGAVQRYRHVKAATQPALARSQIAWTQPYFFYTTGEPGITASVAYEDPVGTVHVLALDIRLDDISKLTMSMRVGKRGLVMVGSEEGIVIGLPYDKRFEDPEARKSAFLKSPRELGISVASAAAAAYRKQLESTSQRPEFFPFRCDGEQWWAKAKPLTLAEDRLFWIAVMAPEDELLGNIGRIRTFIAVATLCALVLVTARSVVIARRFSQPLEALVCENDRISRGDLERGNLIVSSIREVNRLADAQNHMRDALRSLMKLERDLQLARQIQQSTFPTEFPKLAGFDIAAYSEPAEQTGGDSYDIIGYNGTLTGNPVEITTGEAERALLMLADATGHGIGPALSVTQFRAMLRMAVRTGEPFYRFIPQLNAQMTADLSSGRFITAWLAILDAATGTIQWFSAGQAPLLRYIAAEDRFEDYAADTLPLGILEEVAIEPREAVTMRPGDVFAAISDGIFEADNRAGVQYGTERVIDIIRKHRDASASEILQAIRAAVAEFTHDAPAADDRTLVLVKRV